MPPRFAYWTILVDNQPTSFRSSSADDLLPTFNRLKAKNPSAVMMWFQGGKLWPSRLDAQEAMRARGDIGRKHDPRQRPLEGDPSTTLRAGGFSPRRESRQDGKLEWKPKSPNAREVARRDWKPKPYTPKPEAADRSEKIDWQPRSRRSGEAAKADKPEWKPKGSFKPEFKPKTYASKADARPEWRAKSFNPKGKSFKRSSPKPPAFAKATAGRQAPSPRNSEKLEWKPKADLSRRSGEAAKGEIRDPKSEIRDRKKWRPGGDHQDPRQKYKDAKKAKWTRFKQAIRARSSRPPKKRDR